MSDVSSRAVSHLLDALAKRSVSLEPYLELLEVSERELRDPTHRIDWDVFARFLERLAKQRGGRPGLARLVAEIGSPPLASIARAVTARTMSLPALYELGGRWLSSALFPNTSATHETLSSGRIRQEVRIADGFRDSPEFFYLLLGFLRATPRALGLGDARVKMTLGERRATFMIRVPRLVRLRHWLHRRRSQGDVWSGAIVELNLQRSQLEDRYRVLADSNARVAARSKDAALLVELGQEIARHTNIVDLAEAAVRLLGDYFALSGAALWASGLEAGRLDEMGRFGETEGLPTRSFVLRSAGRVVGRLDAWRPFAQPDDELLEKLVPWISLAVANALSFRALSDRTRLLQDEMAERRKAERQLVQAQKLEAVGALAGGLAHDFNNILTAIRVYADLVAKKLPPDHPARADLDEITVAGDRVAALTTQLLAFSRRPVVHPEIVDLNTVLARMEPMLARLMREGGALEVCTAPEPLLVEIDPGQLEQVIINLLHNARDALVVGGLARVSALRMADGGSALRVEDNGVGMDPATLSRAFEPFFTTKPTGQGTGLGLTAAYRIVTELGGRIDMESAPGQGTTVSVELPPCPESSLDASAEPPLRLSGKETVLVVDADPQLLALARRTLEEHGYTVLEATSGEEALRRCDEHSGAIHVVIADLGVTDVPVQELALRIRQSRRELGALIYLSDDVAEAARRRGPLPPGERLVRKPFVPSALLLCVRNAIAETSGE